VADLRGVRDSLVHERVLAGLTDSRDRVVREGGLFLAFIKGQLRPNEIMENFGRSHLVREWGSWAG
jgi:hypothetical protein